MAESRHGDKITTIQGILDSNLTFLADALFLEKFKSSESYQQSMRILGWFYLLYLDLSSHDKTAVNFYYKLSEKFYTFFKRFPTGLYSPFADRLQEYSLKIHESGIKEHWKTLMSFEDMTAVKQRKINANEEFLMNLNDMAGAFYCLGIGLSAALLVFLMEIFFSDCLQSLNWKIVARPLRRKFNNFERGNKVAPARFMQVQPRFWAKKNF